MMMEKENYWKRDVFISIVDTAIVKEKLKWLDFNPTKEFQWGNNHVGKNGGIRESLF